MRWVDRFRSRLARSTLFLLSLGVFGPGAPIAVSDAAAQTASKPAAKKAPASKAPPKQAYSASRAKARRQTLANARAAAAAREARELAQPRFKMDETGALVPDIRAAAGIIYNPTTGEILWEENSLSQRSLASITKAMTALVFLQDDPDLSRQVLVTRADLQAASTTYLIAGERVQTRDLLHVLLIGSDNAAARILARVSPAGAEAFIGLMNETARDLGLASTRFVDPSGLSAGNVSSAYDISRLIFRAAADERIAAIMRMPSYSFSTSRRQNIRVNNTNKLIEDGLDVRGGKTGFISKAGYCLATLLKLPTGDQVAVVVLGARSNTGRFMETRHLFNWFNDRAAAWFGTVEVQPQPEHD